ncbi:MAG: hypothetical protein ACJ72N_14190 [Labedaea sp.]
MSEPLSAVSAVAIDWGPVAAWAGVCATLLVVVTTSMVALGTFANFRGPRVRLTFEPSEPWCRRSDVHGGSVGLWVRIGVENVGRGPARGCIGRLIRVVTDGDVRADVDPVQLRWAGVPRSRAFDPMDVRRDQREFLNVLCLFEGSHWRMVTFEDPDFDPGFATELPLDGEHDVQISVFADNAKTITKTLVAQAHPAGGDATLRLV